MTKNQLERNIAERVIDALLAKGWPLSIYNDHNSSEPEIHRSTDRAAILAKMFTRDQEKIIVHKEDGRVKGVYLMYGEGYDIISNYSGSLDEVLKPIHGYIQSLMD